MRSTYSSRYFSSVLCTVLASVLLMVPFILCGAAQDEQLSIEVLDLEQSGDNVMYEGSTYTVGIGVSGGLPILSGVTVSVPWATYVTTNETPIIEFTAPLYTDHPSFTMTAEKPGFLSANLTFSVLRGALHISTPSTSVREQASMELTVTDQHGFPIEDATIQLRGVNITTTDAAGKATATAPEVNQDQEVVVSVMKDGYVSGTRTVVVSNIHSQLFTVDLSQILPIIIAGVVVIFAVGVVRWRQMHRPRHVHHHEVLEPSTIQLAHKPSTESSKVEEIRIPLVEKKKQTTFIPREKPEHHPDAKPVGTADWFQGTDYAKFKLDEMTGKIDGKKEGKWFVGEGDIESKVDETLKKKVTPKREKH